MDVRLRQCHAPQLQDASLSCVSKHAVPQPFSRMESLSSACLRAGVRSVNGCAAAAGALRMVAEPQGVLGTHAPVLPCARPRGLSGESASSHAHTDGGQRHREPECRIVRATVLLCSDTAVRLLCSRGTLVSSEPVQ
jgi:hypothetical protein